jgi:hypothetical protein
LGLPEEDPPRVTDPSEMQETLSANVRFRGCDPRAAEITPPGWA